MRFTIKKLLFLFVVFSIVIHLIVHVVHAGPPDLTGPKIPRAEYPYNFTGQNTTFIRHLYIKLLTTIRT